MDFHRNQVTWKNTAVWALWLWYNRGRSVGTNSLKFATLSEVVGFGVRKGQREGRKEGDKRCDKE